MSEFHGVAALLRLGLVRGGVLRGSVLRPGADLLRRPMLRRGVPGADLRVRGPAGLPDPGMCDHPVLRGRQPMYGRHLYPWPVRRLRT